MRRANNAVACCIKGNEPKCNLVWYPEASPAKEEEGLMGTELKAFFMF